ncbi:LysE/ArgO family amino acid transporter [Citricoccus sp. GCM10030269]|uniref:LysE/ArgO family amino acid transporter n=1 Tax=Citricoccus sp. GCM10030269 TaxID=3273388 RepID=UPI00361016E3
MTIFLTGLLTSLALVVAIGAQSMFIMRQAIRRDRLFLALAICMAGDVVLICAGTAGVGVITESIPWLLTVLKWGGVAYLLWFAVGSFRSAFQTRRLQPAAPDGGADLSADSPIRAEILADGGSDGDSDGGSASRGNAHGKAHGNIAVSERSRLSVRLRQPPRVLTPALTVALTALSVSLLNPHAILDTVVMLGTLANSYEAQKWIFATGALAGSAIWFLTLGLGVRALAPLLDTPRTWKIVDVAVGIVMVCIAGSLALG